MPCFAINLAGYIYVCYESTGTLNVNETRSVNDHEIIFFKIEPNEGNCVWQNQLPIFNTYGDNINPNIVVDTAGDIYLTYQTTGTMSNGDQTLTGSSDIIVFKLSPPLPAITFIKPTDTSVDDYY